MTEPGRPGHGSRDPYLLVLLVLAAVFCGVHLASVWHPYRWLNGDGSFYLGVSRHLVETGSLVQDHNHPRSWYERDLGWNRNLDAGWSNIAIGRDGTTWYPKHPVLLPVIAAPFYFAFGIWGSLIFNVLLTLLLPLLAYRIGAQLAPRWAALLTAALFAAAPVYREQAWSFSNDVLQAVLFLAALDQAFRDRGLRAGLLLGLAVFAKFTTVVAAPAVGLVFLLRRDYRELGRCVASAAAIVGVMALANWWMYGGPLTTGYQRILVMKDGATALHSHADDFRWGELGTRLGALLGGRDGLLVRWPLWAVGVLGAGLLAARRRTAEAGALLWALVAPVIFHAPYTWYRIAFVLPALAVGAPAAAALLALGREGTLETPSTRRLRWGRLALAGLVGVPLVIGGVRWLVTPAPASFLERVREARVTLGDVPCDYFNNQNRRWECSGADRGDDLLMTGATDHPRLSFGGERRRMVLLSPHPSGRPRAIEYDLPPGATRVRLEYGVGDRGDTPVPLRVLAAGTVVHEAAVERGLEEVVLELPPGAKTLRLEVSGRRRSTFGFDGEAVVGGTPAG